VEGQDARLHRQHLPVHASRLRGFCASAACRPPSASRRRHRDGRAAGADHVDQEGLITSVQAIYVLADDLTDPAPATAFSHLDATVA
jgi:hypothetical protein